MIKMEINFVDGLRLSQQRPTSLSTPEMAAAPAQQSVNISGFNLSTGSPTMEDDGFMRKRSNCQQRIRTTCLFCHTFVILGDEEVDDSDEKRARRRDLLESLSRHLQSGFISSEIIIPPNCTKKMFPFCSSCENLVNGIWKQDEVIQRATAEINSKLAELERIVVDAKVLGDTLHPSIIPPSMTFVESQKFTKLRDLLYKRYYNKVIAEFRLKTNNTLHEHCYEESECRLQEVEEVTVNIDPTCYEADMPTEGKFEEVLGVRGRQNLSPLNESDNEEDSQGSENEESTRLPSQDPLNSGYGSDCTTYVCHQSPSAEGARETALNKQCQEEEGGGDFANEVSATRTRRRRFFEGVEICKFTRHSSSGITYCMQCGLCDYLLEIPSEVTANKNRLKKTENYKKIKIHISTAHANNPPVPKLRNPNKVYEYFCTLCKIKLPDKKARLEHIKLHGPLDNFEICIQCDHCGEPVPGSVKDLRMHMLTHKNDAERKEAFAAGDLGCSNKLLSKKRPREHMECSNQLPVKKKLDTGNACSLTRIIKTIGQGVTNLNRRERVASKKIQARLSRGVSQICLKESASTSSTQQSQSSIPTRRRGVRISSLPTPSRSSVTSETKKGGRKSSVPTPSRSSVTAETRKREGRSSAQSSSQSAIPTKRQSLKLSGKSSIVIEKQDLKMSAVSTPPRSSIPTRRQSRRLSGASFLVIGKRDVRNGRDPTLTPTKTSKISGKRGMKKSSIPTSIPSQCSVITRSRRKMASRRLSLTTQRQN